VVITVVKYVPQAWLNYQRKSTTGWDITQILLDLTGGVLSIAQLVLDSAYDADWSGVTGNPIKFLLGNVSIIFDVLFVYQHYVLYRSRTEPESERDDGHDYPSTRSPLLSEEGLPR
jgi:cystinosin